MKIYKKIEPIKVAGSDARDELRICVEYTKGGYNNKRGIYAWITPIHRGNGFESIICLGELRECGFKVCLKEMGRKNQKVEDAICTVVEPLADKIAEHYNKCEFHEISRILCAAVENI